MKCAICNKESRLIRCVWAGSKYLDKYICLDCDKKIFNNEID